MRMCQAHWDKLKTAIFNRNLDNLISKNGEEVISVLEGQIQGADDKQNFDPLLDAYFKIISAVTKMAPDPMYLFFTKEDGTEYCPVCEAYIHKDDLVEHGGYAETDEKFDKFWFEDLADVELKICRDLGLTPKLN